MINKVIWGERYSHYVMSLHNLSNIGIFVKIYLAKLILQSGSTGCAVGMCNEVEHRVEIHKIYAIVVRIIRGAGNTPLTVGRNVVKSRILLAETDTSKVLIRRLGYVFCNG